MLDLVEKPLAAEGISFGRLDGSMSQPARSAILSRWETMAKAMVRTQTQTQTQTQPSPAQPDQAS